MERISSCGASLAWIAAFLCAQSCLASAGDWPQWRGPSANGTTADGAWTAAWPKEGPKKLWVYKLSGGHSSPIAFGDRVYIQNKDAKEEAIIALDAVSGSKLWSCHLPGGKTVNSTPATDGTWVFAVSGAGHLCAVEVATGKLAWSADLAKDYGVGQAERGADKEATEKNAKGNKAGEEKDNGSFPVSSSPLLYGDVVVLSYGLAFEKEKGKLRWKSEARSLLSPSPVPYRCGERDGVVLITGALLVGLDAQTGKDLFSCPFAMKTGYSDPVFLKDQVFHAGAAFKIKEGSAERRKDTDKTKTGVGGGLTSPVQVLDHLYASVGGWGDPIAAKFSLKCVDTQTFAPKWSQASVGGPLIAADGKLIIASPWGELIVAKASPEKYEELARASVFSDVKAMCWAHPALAHGKLLYRSAGTLACLDISAK